MTQFASAIPIARHLAPTRTAERGRRCLFPAAPPTPDPIGDAPGGVRRSVLARVTALSSRRVSPGARRRFIHDAPDRRIAELEAWRGAMDSRGNAGLARVEIASADQASGAVGPG